MTASQSHANCQHPATKSARAKCRAARKAAETDRSAAITAIVATYYDNTGDTEEIMAALHQIDPSLTAGYYDCSEDVEEIISRLH